MTNRTTRRAASATALCAILLALCSCGNKTDGEYISDDTNSGYEQLTIDGDDIKYQEMTCRDEVYKDDTYTSAGTINDDQTEVDWTQEGDQEGTTSVKLSKDSVVLDDDQRFVKKDSDAGKKMHDKVTEGC
jgi:hypothetical protein